MKMLPDINLRDHSSYRIINGRVRAQVLLTGIELFIFDYLRTAKSAPEIAEKLHSHEANTRLSLDGLTALGLLEKNNGQYKNSAEAEISLTSNSPAYVGEMLLMMNNFTAPAIKDMTGLVKDGPLPVQTDMGDQSIWVEYARTMANYQRCGIARGIAGIVAKVEGFSSFQKMLDLGGGSGIFSIALLAEHPSMKGVIFDQPAVIEMAEEFIAEYEMQERLTVMGGDYATDPLGRDYDLIWASATLNFVRDDLPRMMQKILKALKPGGVFISFADGATHERTRPSMFILENLIYGLNGTDTMFDQGEIAEAMREAGFTSVVSRTIETPMVRMDMDIARKTD